MKKAVSKKTASKSSAASSVPHKQRFVFVGAGSASAQKPKVDMFVPPSVALNLYDKATELKVSLDQLIVTSDEGGYKMVRATHGVHSGAYYWEAKVLPGESMAAWATRSR